MIKVIERGMNHAYTSQSTLSYSKRIRDAASKKTRLRIKSRTNTRRLIDFQVNCFMSYHLISVKRPQSKQSPHYRCIFLSSDSLFNKYKLKKSLDLRSCNRYRCYLNGRAEEVRLFFMKNKNFQRWVRRVTFYRYSFFSLNGLTLDCCIIFLH